MNMNMREIRFWRDNLKSLLGKEIYENGVAGSTMYYADFIIEKFNEVYETNYYAVMDEQKFSILLLSDLDDEDLVTYLMKMIQISLPAGIDVHIYQRIA